MPWPKTGAIQYHAQLGLPDKGRAIKGLVICTVVILGSMKGMSLALVWSLVVVRIALELKYRNTPQKHNNK